MRTTLSYLMILVSLLFIGCDGNELSNNFFDNMNLPSNKRLSESTCDTVTYRKINLKISHESVKESILKKYRLTFSVDGVLYDGGFQKSMVLDSVPVCNKSSLNAGVIYIYMTDSSTKRTYVWRNKKLYSISNANNFEIVLKQVIDKASEDDENAFSIKIK